MLCDCVYCLIWGCNNADPDDDIYMIPIDDCNLYQANQRLFSNMTIWVRRMIKVVTIMRIEFGNIMVQ